MAVALADSVTVRWLRMLPFRWALGALVVAALWSLLSIVLQGGFSNSAGSLLQGLARLSIFVVFPVVVLGFVWGLSERYRLERAIGNDGSIVDRLLRTAVWRNIGKAIVCGIAFGLLTYGLGLFRAFHPWDSVDNIEANVLGVLAFAVVAAPIGLLVGVSVRRSLSRRLNEDAVH
jgi:hypothetical protein